MRSVRDGESGSDIALRILSTTDVHGHLMAYDYYTDSETPHLGLSRVATIIQTLRSEGTDCLLFDSGDFLQGSLLADDAMSAEPGTTNPIITAMNSLGYDAATLGNHEFNFGLDALRAALTQAAFPIVSSNIKGHGLPCPPGLLLKRTLTDSQGVPHDITIGVIGTVPPQIETWDRDHVLGRLETQPSVTASQREADRLIGLGADVVIALCHAGLGTPDAETDAENTALRVAACPGIDLVLAGHTHHQIARAAGDGTAPILMAGYWGSHLGVADLVLRHDGGRWRIADSTVALSAVADAANSDWPPMTESLAQAHAATLAHARAAVGHTPVPLHSYFAQLGGCAALELIAKAQIQEVQRQLPAGETRPVLSAVAPFKAGGRAGPLHYTDIAPGPLKLRDIGNLYLYPNALCAVAVTGQDIQTWLERAAEQFRQIPPGAQGAPLLADDFASHDFDLLYGLTYRIDLSQPVGTRVKDICHLGVPISPSTPLIVATNTYRVGGGGGYPTIDSGQILLHTEKITRDIVRHHVAETPIPAQHPVRVFEFNPMPDTQVDFVTGPGALVHGDEAQRLGLGQGSARPDGFVSFPLHL